MRTSDLIAALGGTTPDAVVYVWVNGERYAVHSVDAWSDNHVDINIVEPMEGETK